MALKDLIDSSGKHQKIGLSEERVNAIIPELRQYVAYWREYPDMFVDFLQDGGDDTRERRLEFYFYQRVFLRVAMRYKYVYMVFPRAYSKSFLSILVLMLKCILYPRAKLFVTAGGKQQAAGIMVEKVEEICSLVPALERELDMRPGRTRKSKDYAIYMFKNGSYFDNIAARESSRGKRRHSGLVEECVGVDGDILQTVIIPTMNVSRICMDGSMHPEEALNQSQIFVKYFGQNEFIEKREISMLLGSLDCDHVKKLTQEKPVELRGHLEQKIRSEAPLGNVQRLIVGSSESKRRGSKQVMLQNMIQSALHGDMQLDINSARRLTTFLEHLEQLLVGKAHMLIIN